MRACNSILEALEDEHFEYGLRTVISIKGTKTSSIGCSSVRDCEGCWKERPIRAEIWFSQSYQNLLIDVLDGWTNLPEKKYTCFIPK